MTGPSRAFLVTVTPGVELAQAFGHTALAFEEDDMVVYSYGGYVLPEIRPVFGANEPWSMIGDMVLESLLPVVDGTMRASKVRQNLETFKRHVLPPQKIVLDELHLTVEQRLLLHHRIREDFARTEPGESAPGVYCYRHFADNCVTRIRDEVLAVIAGGEHEALHRDIDESYEDMIETSLREAIRTSPLAVRLFPERFGAGVAAFLPGVPTILRNPPEFLRTLRFVLQTVSRTPAGSTFEGRCVLAAAFELLNVEMTRRPRTLKESLFIPERLRQALASSVKQQSGDTVLTLSRHSSSLV